MDFQHITLLHEQQFKHKQQVKEAPIGMRIHKLKQLKQSILRHRIEIQHALAQDFRKPAFETDITEIYPVISQLNHAADSLPNWAAPQRVNAPLTYLGTQSEIHYEPKGQCLIIAPWNYPFALVMSPLIYAIAAGNTAMIKPSEFAPHIGDLMKKILGALFTENEVAIVQGDVAVATHLLGLKFDHIFFTGSPVIGKIVMKAAAHHLTSVTLELGGKSPVIIDNTANLAKAAETIMWGKMLNNGQTCIEPDYILIAKELEDAFIECCKRSVDKLYGSDLFSNSDCSRIINQHHCNRIVALLVDAKNKGAAVRYGGQYDISANYIEPTILSHVPENARICHEEIFGPILYTIPFSSLDEAIEKINRLEKPLALYIFSKSKKNQEYLIQRTSAGGTCINDLMIQYTHPELPFGGVNYSGIGKTHGKFGFIEFSNQRSIVAQRSSFSAARLLYPPYHKKWKKTLVDLMLRYL
jgi:aldehyde dehydrogenase (NAD+)